jgi:hypothetical protein
MDPSGRENAPHAGGVFRSLCTPKIIAWATTDTVQSPMAPAGATPWMTTDRAGKMPALPGQTGAGWKFLLIFVRRVGVGG